MAATVSHTNNDGLWDLGVRSLEGIHGLGLDAQSFATDALDNFGEMFGVPLGDRYQSLVYPESSRQFNDYLQETLGRYCERCRDREAFCLCGTFCDPISDDDDQQEPAQGTRNEAAPQLPQEMESNSIGLGAPAPPFTDSSIHTPAMMAHPPSLPSDATHPPAEAEPSQTITSDPSSTFDATMPYQDAAQANGHVADTENDNLDRESQPAYAKLVFPDGDYLLTTTSVILGRNMERYRQYRRERKRARRARQALNTYRKEPSQHSQPGDDDEQVEPSNSSQSLEGRPAPPSNFSEQGGPVWYMQHSDNEAERRRAKTRRRVSHFSKSSSTTSIAPASLHAGMNAAAAQYYESITDGDTNYLPVHTEIPAHITKISKEHLEIRYNFQLEHWEVEVVGQRAFVNEILFQHGAIVPISHDDEIIISSLVMTFKLPDNARQTSPGLSHGTFSESGRIEASIEDTSDDERERGPSTSPARRLSNAMLFEDSEEESEEEDDEDEENVPNPPKGSSKRPKLQLKTKASRKSKVKPLKLNSKGKQQKSVQREASSEEPEVVSDKKAQKRPEKKPKGGAGKTIPGTKQEAVKKVEPSPEAAPFITPGSALEGIPVDQLPEKRKGPGRPAKEGNVSKRDQQLVKKLVKEYEKRGEEVPVLRDLVEEVRRQSKMKALQAKMAQNGQLQPGEDLLPSMEDDANGGGTGTDGANRADSGEPSEAKNRASPKPPKRQVRALSPVPPMEECTPEQLKRPEGTYVTILDSLLSNHPTGVADLQEIYELAVKKHPFFKYNTGSVGWQSSIRHNLLSSGRFKSVGKSGKGKLWTINHDFPLEKEKRKKAETPARTQAVNGQAQQQQVQYAQAYQQPGPNGQPQMGPGGYHSPYVMNQGFPPPQYGQPPQQPQYAPQPPPPPKTPFQLMIEEIVDFTVGHVKHYAQNPPEADRQHGILTHFVNYLSDSYHGTRPRQETIDSVKANRGHPCFGAMGAIFTRHKPDIIIPDPWSDIPLEDQVEKEQLRRALAEQARALQEKAQQQLAAQSPPAEESGLQQDVAQQGLAPVPMSSVGNESQTAAAEIQTPAAPGAGTKRAAEEDIEDEGAREMKRTRAD